MQKFDLRLQWTRYLQCPQIFTPLNVQFFRLCFSSYKCALWLHCRHRRDVSPGCDQRCPNWQRRRLCLALQLLAATTTSAQTAANGHKRQVRDMICQFVVWIWGLVLFWSCYSDSEWWSLRTTVILVVKLFASSLAFHHEILYACSVFSFHQILACFYQILIHCSIFSFQHTANSCLWGSP